jgi:hypothetical protein
MRWWIYQFGAAGSALAVFLGMSCLYSFGDGELYEQILRYYGVVPFQPPFVDISFLLANWECARQGVDVILSNPCDVLHRVYTYSPLWLAASNIPLSVSDTKTVGWTLDLLFILSLSLMPPPRRRLELVLVLTATLSTTVVFVLERANIDILLFMLVLATGIFAECRLVIRLMGYFAAVLSALLKYYPITVLIILFRERLSIFVSVVLIVAGTLAAFWAEYGVEIVRGLPNIPNGRYDTDLFAAKNLPFMIGMLAEHIAQPSPNAALVGVITKAGLYATLVGACVAICRRLLRLAELHASLTALPGLDRTLLVIGSAVITGCFFAGQSIGYRGVFLLLVIPGLLGISRTSVRKLWVLGLGTGVVVVLLMWGECFRLALYGLLDTGISDALAGEMKILFWLFRELCWWWTVAFMLAVLADFLRDSPIIRSVSSIFDHSMVWVRRPTMETPVQRRDLGPRGGRGSRYC